MLSIEDWHRRYLEQAGWSIQIRNRFFKTHQTGKNLKVLDVGSGTGAILSELQSISKIELCGLDIHRLSLDFSKKNNPGVAVVQADGFSIPFPKNCFDIAFCHFTLLWVCKPVEFLAEMIRIVKPNGWIAAFAEPDHLSRLDYPDDLASLGYAQTQSLKIQGADITIGRKLAGLFFQSGLTEINAGILGAEWNPINPISRGELNMLTNDLENLGKSQEFNLMTFKEEITRNKGDRVLFVPTFYAWGCVSST